MTLLNDLHNGINYWFAQFFTFLWYWRNSSINSIFTCGVSVLRNRPVSWCPLGIFWGLPAGVPGRPADARASSHQCRRIRSQPLSTPPSPSHLPSACRGARCQGNRWETGREDSIAEMSGMANTNNTSVSVVHDQLIGHKDVSFTNMMVLSCSLGGDKSHLKPGVYSCLQENLMYCWNICCFPLPTLAASLHVFIQY